MHDDGDRWRALLRRWFIEYNPLYLLSATLVLGGTTALSHAIAARGLGLGGVAVGGIAELYAWALIGGAALLVRMDLKRPAALLALLAVLYQCDPTLSNETWAWCGGVGLAASSAWLLLFAAKLVALQRALRLSGAGSALAVPLLGGAGVAVFPHLLRDVDGRTGTFLVAAWVFATLAAGLWTSRRLAHPDGLDVRALRAIRGTWLLWAAALLAHVLFWCTEDDLSLDPVALLPGLALLGTRALRPELARWALVAAVLGLTAALAPAHLSLAALSSAAVLLLDALRRPAELAPETTASPPPASPYRFAEPPPALLPSTPTLRFERADPAALRRLVVGAVGALYLAAWTHGWSGGALPHAIALDVALAVASLGLAWRLRSWLAPIPLLVAETHLAVQLHLVRLPHGALEIGAAAVALGFVLLGGSLFATWRLRAPDAATAPDAEGWPPSPPAPPPPATSR
ncbi:MAG: hypothetical protein KC619_14415 [Myxococcales bacterium]|nr:hypothetical protein [Myxococcales bacterium]